MVGNTFCSSSSSDVFYGFYPLSLRLEVCPRMVSSCRICQFKLSPAFFNSVLLNTRFEQTTQNHLLWSCDNAIKIFSNILPKFEQIVYKRKIGTIQALSIYQQYYREKSVYASLYYTQQPPTLQLVFTSFDTSLWKISNVKQRSPIKYHINQVLQLHPIHLTYITNTWQVFLIRPTEKSQ